VQGSPALFADDFSSGGFANWTTVTRLTIDGSIGSPSAPSAKGSVAGQSGFAARNLGADYAMVCMSERLNVTSIASSPDLFRLRTAANGPIVKVWANASRVLWIRSDVSGMQVSSGAVLPIGSWNTVELCGTVGSTSTWTLYLNGSAVVNGWTANTGTTPVGRIQIGDTATNSWTINFDDIRLDQLPG
jgi:hypothetical protein